MQVNRYLFQSPYSSQVQIGRLDENTSTRDETQQETSRLTESTNNSLQNAQNFQASNTGEVKTTVSSNNLLDTYA